MSLKYVLRDAPGKVPPGGISSKLKKTAPRRKKPFSQVHFFALFGQIWTGEIGFLPLGAVFDNFEPIPPGVTLPGASLRTYFKLVGSL